MKPIDIAQLRLRNQRLTGPAFGTAAEVVDWLVAVQAQDYAGAKWALSLRMQAATDSSLDKAFADRSILRTHVMRPTWHFVTPADIRWMLALTAPRVYAVSAYMIRRVGLDAATIKRSLDVIAGALQGGVQLTRDELRDRLQGSGIAVDNGTRLAYIMMCAELEGLICSGARRGRQFTYALLEERAPGARTLPRDQALAELAQRYFLSRGPATVYDFAKWSGLAVSDARQGLENVKTLLQEAVVDGQTYWLPDLEQEKSGHHPTAHLLSICDEYISSYKDRSAIGEAEFGPALIAMGNALSYIIVLDGQIAGTWRRTLKNTRAIVETKLFSRLTASEKQAVAAAFKRYGEFLEMPVVVS